MSKSKVIHWVSVMNLIQNKPFVLALIEEDRHLLIVRLKKEKDCYRRVGVFKPKRILTPQSMLDKFKEECNRLRESDHHATYEQKEMRRRTITIK